MAFLYVNTALLLILIYHIHIGKTFDQIITRHEMCVYVILRRVRVTIFAMNNQGMLRILSVCL